MSGTGSTTIYGATLVTGDLYLNQRYVNFFGAVQWTSNVSVFVGTAYNTRTRLRQAPGR